MIKIKLPDKLYIGESLLEENINKLCLRLRFRPKKTKLYTILVSENPSDQLDIVQSHYLGSKLYNSRVIKLVGLASTHKEAVELVCKITDECVAKTGGAYIKQFLEGETS